MGSSVLTIVGIISGLFNEVALAICEMYTPHIWAINHMRGRDKPLQPKANLFNEMMVPSVVTLLLCYFIHPRLTKLFM